MLSEFLQFLFSGMTVGTTYALVALGFTLIYNASNVINFAQGEFIMLGGMLAVFFTHAGLPMPVALILAIAVPALVGVLVEKIDYAIERYTSEVKRLYGVMDQQLASSKFIACNQYTLADVAIFPWLRSWENQGIDWADYPRLKDWFHRISQRPAVQRPRSPTTRRATPCLAARSTQNAEERQRVVYIGHQEDS
jgi:hypothetical protein